MNNLYSTASNQLARFVMGCFVAGLVSVSSSAQIISADFDMDGVSNLDDNCSFVANENQVDADADGYGNLCDGDLNNDGIINFLDYSAFTQLFLSDDPVADLNSDGTVNFLDVALLTDRFFEAPGPSGVALSNFSYSAVRVYQTAPVGSLLHMKQAPGSPGQWYGLQRQGKVVSFSADETLTTVTEVLDIETLVDTNFEGGALGLAFHPQFADNGFLYISYTASGPNFQTPLLSRVSRFETTVNADGIAIADPDSEVVHIEVNQPFANHNGGDVAFGPDGYLYWGLGDGGSSGDPGRNGQNTSTLLGAMLRLDVNVTQAQIEAGEMYEIPADNPFAANVDCIDAACPEIFAWGLRNPFRFNFDSLTGDLWAGDVGQNAIEEVDVIVNGGNYGWRCYEGNQTFNTFTCDLTQEFAAPVHTYSHAVGFSITGGSVYRGTATPDMNGLYLYADFGSGTVWGLYGADPTAPLITSNHSVVAFTEDSDGEIYYIDLAFGGNSAIYRIEATVP